MNYYELKFSIAPNTEINRDVLSALLGDSGFESFIETEIGIDAYVDEKTYPSLDIQEILADFPFDEVQLDYIASFVQAENWNEEWEKNFFQPILIGDQCVIHSSFHQNIPQATFDILIDPKMAFGTGHHETTSMMVSYLLKENVTGKSFLDMGCGTAVLAILAKKKGADPVVGIDIDEWAYRNSIENTALNHTPEIEIVLGGAELLTGKKFDVIFANINRNILLNDLSAYANGLNPGGALFMSGFYDEDIPLLILEAEKYGLRFRTKLNKNNWAAIHLCMDAG